MADFKVIPAWHESVNRDPQAHNLGLGGEKVSDYANLLDGFTDYRQKSANYNETVRRTNANYDPAKLREEQYQLELENQRKQFDLEFDQTNKQEITNVDLGYKRALTSSTVANTEGQLLQNEYYPRKAEADIANSQSITNERNSMLPIEVEQAIAEYEGQALTNLGKTPDGLDAAATRSARGKLGKAGKVVYPSINIDQAANPKLKVEQATEVGNKEQEGIKYQQEYYNIRERVAGLRAIQKVNAPYSGMASEDVTQEGVISRLGNTARYTEHPDPEVKNYAVNSTAQQLQERGSRTKWDTDIAQLPPEQQAVAKERLDEAVVAAGATTHYSELQKNLASYGLPDQYLKKPEKTLEAVNGLIANGSIGADENIKKALADSDFIVGARIVSKVGGNPNGAPQPYTVNTEPVAGQPQIDPITNQPGAPGPSQKKVVFRGQDGTEYHADVLDPKDPAYNARWIVEAAAQRHNDSLPKNEPVNSTVQNIQAKTDALNQAQAEQSSQVAAPAGQQDPNAPAVEPVAEDLETTFKKQVDYIKEAVKSDEYRTASQDDREKVQRDAYQQAIERLPDDKKEEFAQKYPVLPNYSYSPTMGVLVKTNGFSKFDSTGEGTNALRRVKDVRDTYQKDYKRSLAVRYQASLGQFISKLEANPRLEKSVGTQSTPEQINNWVKSKLGVGDKEVADLLANAAASESEGLMAIIAQVGTSAANSGVEQDNLRKSLANASSPIERWYITKAYMDNIIHKNDEIYKGIVIGEKNEKDSSGMTNEIVTRLVTSPESQAKYIFNPETRKIVENPDYKGLDHIIGTDTKKKDSAPLAPGPEVQTTPSSTPPSNTPDTLGSSVDTPGEIPPTVAPVQQDVSRPGWMPPANLPKTNQSLKKDLVNLADAFGWTSPENQEIKTKELEALKATRPDEYQAKVEQFRVAMEDNPNRLTKAILENIPGTAAGYEMYKNTKQGMVQIPIAVAKGLAEGIGELAVWLPTRIAGAVTPGVTGEELGDEVKQKVSDLVDSAGKVIPNALKDTYVQAMTQAVLDNNDEYMIENPGANFVKNIGVFVLADKAYKKALTGLGGLLPGVTAKVAETSDKLAKVAETGDMGASLGAKALQVGGTIAKNATNDVITTKIAAPEVDPTVAAGVGMAGRLVGNVFSNMLSDKGTQLATGLEKVGVHPDLADDFLKVQLGRIEAKEISSILDDIPAKYSQIDDFFRDNFSTPYARQQIGKELTEAAVQQRGVLEALDKTGAGKRLNKSASLEESNLLSGAAERANTQLTKRVEQIATETGKVKATEFTSLVDDVYTQTEKELTTHVDDIVAASGLEGKKLSAFKRMNESAMGSLKEKASADGVEALNSLGDMVRESTKKSLYPGIIERKIEKAASSQISGVENSLRDLLKNEYPREWGDIQRRAMSSTKSSTGLGLEEAMKHPKYALELLDAIRDKGINLPESTATKGYDLIKEGLTSHLPAGAKTDLGLLLDKYQDGLKLAEQSYKRAGALKVIQARVKLNKPLTDKLFGDSIVKTESTFGEATTKIEGRAATLDEATKLNKLATGETPLKALSAEDKAGYTTIIKSSESGSGELANDFISNNSKQFAENFKNVSKDRQVLTKLTRSGDKLIMERFKAAVSKLPEDGIIRATSLKEFLGLSTEHYNNLIKITGKDSEKAMKLMFNVHKLGREKGARYLGKSLKEIGKEGMSTGSKTRRLWETAGGFVADIASGKWRQVTELAQNRAIVNGLVSPDTKLASKTFQQAADILAKRGVTNPDQQTRLILVLKALAENTNPIVKGAVIGQPAEK